jgi:predicted enzyme related to lactoylglutathione lyase
MPDTSRGRFCWYDLMTTDPEAAKAFYTGIAGWGTSIFEGAGSPYTMWTRGETPLGGVMELPESARAAGSPPHWLAYISTPDVDATANRAAELGGSVLVPPTDIPTVGRFTVLADPQGAFFAAFTAAASTPGHDGPAEVGEFSWHELATADVDAAFAFYAELFGWTKGEAHDMGPAGAYQIFAGNGLDLGGIFVKPAEMPGPPSWLFYVRVPDVHAKVEAVKAARGRLLNGPMEVPGGSWIAQCMDPQGAMFAVHHWPAGG